MSEIICLLGFGEVGQTLAADLRARGDHQLVAWDVLFPRCDSGPSLAASAGLARAARDARDAIAQASVVISAVTAAQCVAAAHTAGASLQPGTWFLDLNSVAPTSRQRAAHCVGAAGGRYVEGAVMSPISPKRSASPILLGGPHAASCLPVLERLGFSGASVYSAALGPASAAKMCRSVMIKGIEALVTESLLAARRYGVEGAVLESLQDFLPGSDWRRLSRYMISRTLQHGRRRAEELREVAVTVSDAGIEPWMSTAAEKRQAWAAAFASRAALEPVETLLDALLASIPNPGGEPGC